MTVRLVTEPEETRRWVRMWGPASGLPTSAVERRAEIELARPDWGENHLGLAGHLDEEIVASAVVSVRGEVAGLYGIAVRPDLQGRGLGRAITESALTAARRHGAVMACLQATSRGYWLYRNLGFQEISSYQVFEIPAR